MCSMGACECASTNHTHFQPFCRPCVHGSIGSESSSSERLLLLRIQDLPSNRQKPVPYRRGVLFRGSDFRLHLVWPEFARKSAAMASEASRAGLKLRP